MLKCSRICSRDILVYSKRNTVCCSVSGLYKYKNSRTCSETSEYGQTAVLLLCDKWDFISGEQTLLKNAGKASQVRLKSDHVLFPDAFPLAMQDLLCMNNDFPPRAHCLVRWLVTPLSLLYWKNVCMWVIWWPQTIYNKYYILYLIQFNCICSMQWTLA